jgi:hypothetical protein
VEEDFCVEHRFYFVTDEEQCPVCEGMEIVKERVRELHKPITLSSGRVVCNVCDIYMTDGDYPESIMYPCDTIKAMDGEKDA